MQSVQVLWERTRPHPPGVAAWVNTFIAAHIPAYEMARDRAVSITDIYRQGKNPESCVPKDLIMPHDFRCESELYKVWDLSLPTGHEKINSTVLKLFFKGAPHPTSIR